MEINGIGSNSRIDPSVMVTLSPGKVPAPAHPLADREGLVPAEVFDAPPELMGAILESPIRGVDSTQGSASGTGSAAASSSSRIELDL